MGLNIRDIAPPPHTKLLNPEYVAKGYASDVRQFLRQDGQLKWMTAQGIVLKDDQEKPGGISSTCTTARPKCVPKSNT